MDNKSSLVQPNRNDEPCYQATVLLKIQTCSELCDVRIVVGGRRFPVHKVILCGASEMLRCLLSVHWKEGSMHEVELKSMSAPAFNCILNFIYTGSVDMVTLELLLDVDAAARFLLIEPLYEKTKQMIIRHVSVSNVAVMAKHACIFGDDLIQKHCEKYTCEHFGKILDSPSFLEFSFECIEHYFKSSEIVVDEGETKLLHALGEWVSARPETRVVYFKALIRLIRFIDMAPEELQAIYFASGRHTEIGKLAFAAYKDVHESVLSLADGDKADKYEDRPELHTSTVQPPTLRRRQSRATSRGSFDRRDINGPRFRVARKFLRNIRFDFVLSTRSSAFGAEVPSSLNSPWYKCGGGLLWRLEIYPKGSTNNLRDWISVFLRCCDESATDAERTVDCSASFSIFLLDQNFGEQEQCFEATKIFSTEEPCWGRSRFIKRAELLENSRRYRDENGNVVIGCSVTY